MKKKRIDFIMLLILIVVIVGTAIGGAYAYYISGSDVRNQVLTKGSEVILQELFNPNDLWLPGETKAKELRFGNQGDSDQVIRFKVTEQWYDNNGTPDNLWDDTPWTPTGTYLPAPTVINWSSEITGGQWVKIGDWYYYTKILAAGGAGGPAYTPDVMSSVTFSPAVSNAGAGAADDFSDKRYSMLIEMEALDVNTIMTVEAWGMTFTESVGMLTWSVSP